MRGSRRSVVILQDYVPAYREPFFRRLAEALGSDGIELVVAVGSADDGQRARGDAALESLAVAVPATQLGLGGRRVVLRRSGQWRRHADLVIAEQGIRNVDVWWALASQRLGRPPVALWGHGRTYVKARSTLEERLLRVMMRQAHWFFAYTEGGARAVVEGGFPSERITVVQNTTDTAELARLRAEVDAPRAEEVRRALGLEGRRVALFVGALDASKRIGFLLAAAARVAVRMDDFALVVAGEGPLSREVREAAQRFPWLVPVGRATGSRLAELGAISELILCPGRVGLIATDAFALGLPIVTTHWPFHAPEFEYLVDGVNAVVSENDRDEYTRSIVHALRDERLRIKLKNGCSQSASVYTVQSMVDRFNNGLRIVIEDSLRFYNRSERNGL